MEENEKVESFREQVEKRLETLESAIADLKATKETQEPPKGDT